MCNIPCQHEPVWGRPQHTQRHWIHAYTSPPPTGRHLHEPAHGDVHMIPTVSDTRQGAAPCSPRSCRHTRVRAQPSPLHQHPPHRHPTFPAAASRCHRHGARCPGRSRINLCLIEEAEGELATPEAEPNDRKGCNGSRCSARLMDCSGCCQERRNGLGSSRQGIHRHMRDPGCAGQIPSWIYAPVTATGQDLWQMLLLRALQ